MTSNKATIDAIFDIAIKEEEKAAEMYVYLSKLVKNSQMSQAFLEYAEEERGHKAKLTVLRKVWPGLGEGSNAPDLKIADYIVPKEPTLDMGYQEILTILMAQEKNAFRMYSDLANAATDPESKKVLLLLAQEEAKHKLRFELEYEQTFMAEN